MIYTIIRSLQIGVRHIKDIDIPLRLLKTEVFGNAKNCFGFDKFVSKTREKLQFQHPEKGWIDIPVAYDTIYLEDLK
jgi:hypothetical protein